MRYATRVDLRHDLARSRLPGRARGRKRRGLHIHVVSKYHTLINRISVIFHPAHMDIHRDILPYMPNISGHPSAHDMTYPFRDVMYVRVPHMSGCPACQLCQMIQA